MLAKCWECRCWPKCANCLRISHPLALASRFPFPQPTPPPSPPKYCGPHISSLALWHVTEMFVVFFFVQKCNSLFLVVMELPALEPSKADFPSLSPRTQKMEVRHPLALWQATKKCCKCLWLVVWEYISVVVNDPSFSLGVWKTWCPFTQPNDPKNVGLAPPSDY